MRLIIAEKPSMARDIARALGATRRQDIRYEGDGLWVSWCIGHLVGIAAPGEQDPRWRSWSPAALPIIPDTLRWSPLKRSAKHYRALVKLMKDRRVREIVNACDAGREGELIFRAVYQEAGARAPVSRLWLSSLTTSAIRAGMSRLRSGRDYDPLGAAALCRAEADWLVGMNGTRAYSARADGLLSLGRVQTPTLAMIVHREQEIEAFEATRYWLVEAVARGTSEQRQRLRWLDPDQPARRSEWLERVERALTRSSGAEQQRANAKGSRGEARGRGAARAGEAGGASMNGGERVSWRGRWLSERAHAEALAAQVPGATGEVLAVARREHQVPPPQLYHLTALQQAANRRYGYSAEETLSLAQSLYERHKVLSYPRTDSRYLTADLRGEIPKILAALPSEYQGAVAELSRGQLGGRYVNNKKVNDHHAIIPTKRSPKLDALSERERRIYDLVARSLLCALAPAAVDERCVLLATLAEQLWGASGRRERSPGWRRYAPPPRGERGAAQRGAAERGDKRGGKRGDKRGEKKGSAEEESFEISLAVRERIRGEAAEVLERETKPPRPYQEASLLGAMERAGTQLEEAALRAVMRGAGIGTPATRASLIETLLKRGYLMRSGRTLRPTEVGRALIERLPVEAFKSPALTAQWEAKLQAIADGEGSPERFRAEIRAFVGEATQRLLASPRIMLPAGTQQRKRRAPSAGQRGRQSAKRAGQQEQSAPGAEQRGRHGGGGGAQGGTQGGTQRTSAPPDSPPTAEARAAVAGRRCPLCKEGKIILGRRGWGCARWREGCTLVLWFVIDGVTIPPDEAERFFSRRQTRLFYQREGRRWRLTFSPEGSPWFRWEAGRRAVKQGRRTRAPQQRSGRSRGAGASSTERGWRSFQRKKG